MCQIWHTCCCFLTVKNHALFPISHQCQKATKISERVLTLLRKGSCPTQTICHRGRSCREASVVCAAFFSVLPITMEENGERLLPTPPQEKALSSLEHLEQTRPWGFNVDSVSINVNDQLLRASRIPSIRIYHRLVIRHLQPAVRSRSQHMPHPSWM